MDTFDDDCIFKRKKASRRRRLTRNLQDGVDEISTVEDLMIKRHGKRSKSYIPENGVRIQKLLKKISSKNSIVTGDDEERRHIPHPIEAKRSEKSSRGENSSMKSREHRPLSVVEKSPRFQHSAVINRVKKTLSNSETIRDNDSNESIAFPPEDKGMLSTSTPKIHVVKLPRNKVSAYPKPRATTMTDSTISQRRNPSGIKNNIFGEVSLTPIDAKTSVRNDSFRSHKNDNPSRQEKSSSGRRRASSFNGVDVCKVKPTNDHDKVWINHPRSAIFTKNHKMDVDNRVTVISVMKP